MNTNALIQSLIIIVLIVTVMVLRIRVSRLERILAQSLGINVERTTTGGNNRMWSHHALDDADDLAEG